MIYKLKYFLMSKVFILAFYLIVFYIIFKQFDKQSYLSLKLLKYPNHYNSLFIKNQYFKIKSEILGKKIKVI